jgi:two-component system, NarL family, response regulator LiaR
MAVQPAGEPARLLERQQQWHPVMSQTRQRVSRAAAALPRVILGDADAFARRTIRDALQTSGAFTLLAEAHDGVELVELVLHYRPELALVELALPRVGGIDAIERIGRQAPEVRSIALSVRTDSDLQLRALRAGAWGFLGKDTKMEAVTKAMQAVVRGEAAVSRLLTTSLVEHLRELPEPGQGMRPVRSILTGREWEVLDMMVGGASTRQIAARLVLAQDTVYSHVKNIMRKLEVHTRQEAVEAAWRLCRTSQQA